MDIAEFPYFCKNKNLMNFLHLLFLYSLVCQSVLFAQTDTIKKKFKPYGLIDAAPVAINKGDFKPQISLTINSVATTTNLSLEASLAFYTFSDSSVIAKKGKVVSFPTKGNEKIAIFSNAIGYMSLIQIFDTPLSDTSYILKFKKIKKGERIKLFDISLSNTKSDSPLNFYLSGLREFIKLNPTVNIEIYGFPKEKEKVFFDQIKNNDSKRIHFKNSLDQRQTKTITIKILHI